MQINQTSINSFYGLVPLSEYKGTILELTENDKKMIAQLKQQIVEHSLDDYAVHRNKSLKKNWTEKDQKKFQHCRNKIGENIDFLRDRIQEIKQNRLKEQKNTMIIA